MDWVGLGHRVDGLDWVGFRKLDPCPTLVCRIAVKSKIKFCAFLALKSNICVSRSIHSFLADRTNGRAYATVLRPSVRRRRRRLSVTLCIMAKQCVLEQKLPLRAYRKSYMRNRLVPK